jgi:hypothetical protein
MLGLKLCCRCGREAEYGIVCVLYPIGVSKRPQECSGAVRYCKSCLQKLCGGEHSSTVELRKAVNSALTTLNQRLAERSDLTVGRK